MAIYIPFEKLEVGKTYYMYSTYWHKVLGRATIETIGIATGKGSVFTDWRPDRPDGRGWCMIEANEDYMFDERPTDQEIRDLMEERPYYTLPRVLNGVMYDGKQLTTEWTNKLDELIGNLARTFKNDTRFKMGRSNKFIWASKLDYPITPLLVKSNGEPDWDSIRYVKNKTGYDIHHGERDSFGWLTGVIDEGLHAKSIIFD